MNLLHQKFGIKNFNFSFTNPLSKPSCSFSKRVIFIIGNQRVKCKNQAELNQGIIEQSIDNFVSDLKIKNFDLI